jgi:hypothetical protein
MEGNAVSQNFTPAEHQLIALRFNIWLSKKVKSGDISEAEGEYLIARYVNNAKAASDYSEAEQAKAVGEFVGAAAALTEEIEDRKCRAAGTC